MQVPVFFYFVVFILLPILVIQGLWTRHKASGLPEAAGERKGRRGAGNPLSVLILGDSAGAGVGVSQQVDALSGQLVAQLTNKNYQVAWQLLATTGHTTLDSLKAITALDSQQLNCFNYIVISLGVNDVTSRVSVKEWLEQCDELIRTLNTFYQPRTIFWSDLPPMAEFTAMPQPLRWVVGKRRDKLAQALSNWITQQSNVELMIFPNILADTSQKVSDWIASDGFHPGKKVYALWGKIAAAYIDKDYRVIEDQKENEI